MNTYGLGPISVPETAFPLREGNRASESRQSCRKIFINALRIHNSVLQIFGYIQGLSFFSGCFRIGSGSAMFIAGSIICLGTTEKEVGNDLMNTGIGQIFRGTMEALSVGVLLNIGLDVVFAYAQLHKSEFCA